MLWLGSFFAFITLLTVAVTIVFMMVLLELFLITSLLRKFETVPDLSDGWMRRHVDKAGGSWFWATRLWWRDDDNPG